MAKHVLFYGWNRPIAGRERMSMTVFQEFNQYLGELQQSGTIESFENVFLTAHGGDLNGFTLIRGDREKLQGLQNEEKFQLLIIRAGLLLQSGGLVSGVTGEGVMEWMQLWASVIPD